jgi:histidinol-phosphate phosphatase family protein|tara:strand:- start:3601 stop:4104 length:504 start_codon:yes stop_codon:yes gene_type:complete
MIKENKAIFLDRDGVINKKRNDYVKSINELEIFPDIGQGISNLKKMGFLIIVITNQSVINRKIITVKELKKIHLAIQNNLKQNSCNIDRFYFCPHMPNQNCDCRKPKSGLLLEAINDYSINSSKSWMIGDCLTDIQAGEKVGCKTILLKDNMSFSDIVDMIKFENIS